MPSGSDMGGQGFSARRQNAASLPTFELPPPSSRNPYAYSGHHTGHHTPASLASVSNLLTPTSTIGSNEVSASPSTSSVAPSGPSYHHSGLTSWSPNPGYYSGHGSHFPMKIHSPIVRGHPHSPPSSDGGSMPPYDQPYATTTGPMTPASTLPSMGQQQNMQNQLMSTTPLTNNSANPSPVNAQEAFRPPPTPTFYSAQSTPQSSHFPFSSSGQMASLSAGPVRPQMSPALSSGHMPSLQAQSPHAFQGRFQYGPVMSNLHNPNGQPMLVGNVSMMPSFNSGHAASMHLYGPASAPATPQNERPFKCDQCPQSFNRNHDLKRHKRIHLAVKPFPCGHCDKSFSRKDALKRHILVKGCGKVGDADAKKDVSSSTSPKGAKTETDSKPLPQ